MPKKKLKKFCVTLYYHSYVQKRIEAENEDDALSKARSDATDEEIQENLIEESTDVMEEIK